MEGTKGWRVERDGGYKGRREEAESWRVERDGGYGAIGTRT